MSQTCRSCGAFVLWAETEAGKRIPIDAHPTGDEGNMVVVRRGGKVLALPYDAEKHKGGPRRVSHFATCPNAASHRTKKGAA